MRSVAARTYICRPSKFTGYHGSDWAEAEFKAQLQPIKCCRVMFNVQMFFKFVEWSVTSVLLTATLSHLHASTTEYRTWTQNMNTWLQYHIMALRSVACRAVPLINSDSIHIIFGMPPVGHQWQLGKRLITNFTTNTNQQNHSRSSWKNAKAHLPVPVQYGHRAWQCSSSCPWMPVGMTQWCSSSQWWGATAHQIIDSFGPQWKTMADRDQCRS